MRMYVSWAETTKESEIRMYGGWAETNTIQERVK